MLWVPWPAPSPRPASRPATAPSRGSSARLSAPVHLEVGLEVTLNRVGRDLQRLGAVLDRPSAQAEQSDLALSSGHIEGVDQQGERSPGAAPAGSLPWSGPRQVRPARSFQHRWGSLLCIDLGMKVWILVDTSLPHRDRCTADWLGSHRSFAIDVTGPGENSR